MTATFPPNFEDDFEALEKLEQDDDGYMAVILAEEESGQHDEDEQYREDN